MGMCVNVVVLKACASRMCSLCEVPCVVPYVYKSVHACSADVCVRRSLPYFH